MFGFGLNTLVSHSIHRFVESDDQHEFRNQRRSRSSQGNEHRARPSHRRSHPNRRAENPGAGTKPSTPGPARIVSKFSRSSVLPRRACVAELLFRWAGCRGRFHRPPVRIWMRFRKSFKSVVACNSTATRRGYISNGGKPNTRVTTMATTDFVPLSKPLKPRSNGEFEFLELPNRQR